MNSDGAKVRLRVLTQAADVFGDASVGGQLCREDVQCVAAAEVRVIVQATPVMPRASTSGTTWTLIADARTRTDAALADLVKSPTKFFTDTLNVLGPEVNVKLVGPILREEVVPPEEEEFKDFFDYVPIDPGSFFALCALLIAFVVLYPRIKKEAILQYKSWALRRTMRLVALGKAGYGVSGGDATVTRQLSPCSPRTNTTEGNRTSTGCGRSEPRRPRRSGRQTTRSAISLAPGPDGANARVSPCVWHRHEDGRRVEKQT